MTFEWTHFYEFSKEALSSRASFGSCSEEAVFRTIVSRAYYAAFNVALIFIAERHLTPSGAEKHRWLIIEFKGYVPPKGLTADQARAVTSQARLVGQYLESLRAKRNECDYDLPTQKFNINVYSAQKALKEAERIFQAIATLEALIPPPGLKA